MTGWLQTSGTTRPARVSLDAHIAGCSCVTQPPGPDLRDIDIEGVTTARLVAGTLHLFPGAGDVAVRYRLNVSEDDRDVLVLVGTSVNST
jgi:hypothetical protein